MHFFGESVFFYHQKQLTGASFGEERPRGAHLEHPQANKKQTEPKRARACTLGHFHERAGETLEHKLRLGFEPTPKSLFVSEIRTLEVARRSKSKFTL